jgi:hypothetical protein
MEHETGSRARPFPIDNSRRAKCAMLASLALVNPREAVSRVAHIVEGRWDALHSPKGDYSPVSVAACLADLSDRLGTSLFQFAEEEPLQDLERSIAAKIDQLRNDGPFWLAHIAALSVGRLCYAACRALKPQLAIETGTAYGLTSAFILRAMQDNGCGRLISIDLPPLGRDADRHVGILIPPELRGRWHLIRGSSRRHLKHVAGTGGPIGLFVHDSLHTYRTMIAEFTTVHPVLARPSLVIADDIDGNGAFRDFVERYRPQYAAAVPQPHKGRLTGVALFASDA